MATLAEIWPYRKVKPFGMKDNGGDLVESAFLMQSLLCVRQYFKDGNSSEKALAAKINKLWHEMEFDWYTRGGQNVIYWHWSPNYGWEMNFPLEGYNECLIVYVLAAASPTHTVPAACYHEGWSRSGGIKSDAIFNGYPLEVKHNGAEKTGTAFLGALLLDRTRPTQPERQVCKLVECGAQSCNERLRILRCQPERL